MKIGSVVRTKVMMLGNRKGILGICYGEYKLKLDEMCYGHFFIFENGMYDGFKDTEESDFLKEVGFDKGLSTYQFENVIRLTEDYDSGLFNKALRIGDTDENRKRNNRRRKVNSQ